MVESAGTQEERTQKLETPVMERTVDEAVAESSCQTCAGIPARSALQRVSIVIVRGRASFED